MENAKYTFHTNAAILATNARCSVGTMAKLIELTRVQNGVAAASAGQSLSLKMEALLPPGNPLNAFTIGRKTAERDGGM